MWKKNQKKELGGRGGGCKGVRQVSNRSIFPCRMAHQMLIKPPPPLSLLLSHFFPRSRVTNPTLLFLWLSGVLAFLSAVFCRESVTKGGICQWGKQLLFYLKNPLYVMFSISLTWTIGLNKYLVNNTWRVGERGEGGGDTYTDQKTPRAPTN